MNGRAWYLMLDGRLEEERSLASLAVTLSPDYEKAVYWGWRIQQ